MNLLTIILVLLVFVGALFGLMYLTNKYGTPLMKTLARVAVGIAVLLAVIALLIWGLEYFGVLSTISHVRIPVPGR